MSDVGKKIEWAPVCCSIHAACSYSIQTLALFTNWCSYKKRLGHKQAQTEGNVLTRGKDVQAKERGLRRNQSCRHLGLGLPASGIMRKYISAVWVIQSVILYYGSPGKLIQRYNLIEIYKIQCPKLNCYFAKLLSEEVDILCTYRESLVW